MKFEPESRCGVSCAAFPCEILMEYEKQPGKAEWVKAARAGVDPVDTTAIFVFWGSGAAAAAADITAVPSPPSARTASVRR